ncbi:hypothetical protein NW754_001664 [Fusarium falciforme]|nr:hypothetical protein NW754_001664 [Fusarium falciforme]
MAGGKKQSRQLNFMAQPIFNSFNPTRIFADADKVRECKSCRRCFTTQFQMPQLWWSNYAKKSNGHFGCETFRDEYGIVTSLNAWSRYLVKQLHEGGHSWYKFNTLTRWIASSHQTILLVFESEKQSKLTELIPKGMLDGSHAEPHHDPFWVHVRLLEELSDLQNNAVWTVRTEIRKVEKKKQRSKPDPDYRGLHDLARHAIHVSETLDVCLKTVKSIVEQHKTLEEEQWFGERPKKGASDKSASACSGMSTHSKASNLEPSPTKSASSTRYNSPST